MKPDQSDKPDVFVFDAQLKKHEDMDASYIDFPYDTLGVFGQKGRVKVKALIDGVEYRGSLFKMGRECHFLGITQEIRKKIGKTFGDTVHVELTEDKEERSIRIPDDLQVLFGTHPEQALFFGKLSYTNRKEYVRWIEDAKKPETRQARLAGTIQKLSEGKRNPSEK